MMRVIRMRVVTALIAVAAVGYPLASGAGETTVSGEVELQGQPVGTDPGTSDTSKFGKLAEYRDIPEGGAIPWIKLDLVDRAKGWFAEFRAEDAIALRGQDPFQEDQRYRLRFGKYGLYEIDLEWDQIPHIFSDRARTLFTKDGGDFRLSDSLQSAVQVAPDLLEGFLGSAAGFDLGMRQDTGTFRFRYTPGEGKLALTAGYGVEHQHGSRAIAVSSHFLDGANVVELPEPVDYLTHNFNTAIEYAAKQWLVKLAYEGSVFENGTSTLTWDSPLRLDDAVNASARGRLDLPPRNQAHSVSLIHALSLPLRSRLTGTATYTWMLQDSSFLPPTINTAVFSPLLPGRSLKGQLNVLALNYRYTVHPVAMMTITAGYRLYDLDNKSRSLVFPDYVRADTSLAGVTRRSLPYEFRTQNANLDLTYRLMRGTSLQIKYDWENWHRRFREVRSLNEHGVGPSIDVRPSNWSILRASYRHSWRDPRRYEEDAFLLSFPEGLVVENASQRLLRKFDQAERDRDAFSVWSRITPLAGFALAASVELAADDYDTEFGVLNDLNVTYAVDTTVVPRQGVTLYANYTREEYRSNQRSRFRPVVFGSGVDDPTNDWTSRVRDKVDTWGVGTELTLIPDRLTAEASYSFSLARSPNTTSSAAGGEVEGNGVDFATVRNRLHQFSATATYTVTQQISLRVGYAFEKYEQSDFATDPLAPFMGAIDPEAGGSLFLDAAIPDYEAHIGTFTVAYKF